MTTEHILMLIAMTLYMIMVVTIGILYAHRSKSAGDFYLGGRGLSPLVAAMSAEASDMSGWLLMGLPGAAYLSGLADAGWTAIGLAIGTYINWLLVAKRLRRYTVVANNSITLPDFFSNRFHDKLKILMSVSAVIILVFFVPYTAAGFSACGKLFQSVFGISYIPAMIISAVVIVLYTAIGGFLAESTTDLIQGLLMSAALVVILIFGTVLAGGVGSVVNHAEQMPGFLSLVKTYVPKTNTASPFGVLSIVSILAWGLGYFGMPHVLLRFMAIRKEQELKTSRRIATVWVVISLTSAVLIGIIGAAAYPGLTTKTDAETIFIKISETLGANGFVTALIAGVILAGILAATMSTSDSQLLVASSSISQNFYKGLINKNANDKTVMWVSRITVIAIAIIAAIIAANPDNTIMGVVSFAWAGFGAAFGPVILFSLFWKRTNLWGALAGMIAGGVMVFVWKFLLSGIGGVFGIYELLPAFLIACIFIVVISLMTKAPSKEIEEEFELAASTETLE